MLNNILCYPSISSFHSASIAKILLHTISISALSSHSMPEVCTSAQFSVVKDLPPYCPCCHQYCIPAFFYCNSHSTSLFSLDATPSTPLPYTCQALMLSTCISTLYSICFLLSTIFVVAFSAFIACLCSFTALLNSPTK